MSEVKRYYIGAYSGEAEARTCSPHAFEIVHQDEGRYFVLDENFDRVTAERDAALGREDALREENLKVRDMHAKQCCVFCNDSGNLRAVNAGLQQRLTAADERADVLAGLLRRSQDFVAFVHKCVRRNGEYAPLHRQEMDELNRDLSDYVEPGVPVCEQCRGEGRVGGPAPDEGGGRNCPVCDGTGVIEPATDAALKPAEVAQ